MKKLKIAAVALTVCLIALVVLAAGILLYVNLSADSMIVSATAARGIDADCAIVLGCGVRPDGTPSLMLRDRLDRAVELYQNGACKKLLMSGDHGTQSYDEVNTMKDYAIAAGVPSEDIFMDHAGFSTYESMVRAKKVFLCQSVIVVTQKYHMYRALYIAEKQGLDCRGVCAQEIAYSGQTYRQVREWAAQLKDFFQCILAPDPTYLGDAIPVWGSGDLTNDK